MRSRHHAWMTAAASSRWLAAVGAEGASALCCLAQNLNHKDAFHVESCVLFRNLKKDQSVDFAVE